MRMAFKARKLLLYNYETQYFNFNFLLYSLTPQPSGTDVSSHGSPLLTLYTWDFIRLVFLEHAFHGVGKRITVCQYLPVAQEA